MVFSLAVKALQHPELPADMYAMTPRDKAWLRTKYKPYTELASSAMLHSKGLPAHAEGKLKYWTYGPLNSLVLLLLADYIIFTEKL